jgi:selenocysteine lyase/cysteine desulfurase
LSEPDANDLTFVQNAGIGVNMAARALDLQPGDEVLATDLEYGACDLMWEWLCGRTGAHYIPSGDRRTVARANRRGDREHRIEIPTMGPHRDDLLRISVAPYTEREDVERLLDALPEALRTSRSPA